MKSGCNEKHLKTQKPFLHSWKEIIVDRQLKIIASMSRRRRSLTASEETGGGGEMTERKKKSQTSLVITCNNHRALSFYVEHR